jgi:hypothetical protein
VTTVRAEHQASSAGSLFSRALQAAPPAFRPAGFVNAFLLILDVNPPRRGPRQFFCSRLPRRAAWSESRCAGKCADWHLAPPEALASFSFRMSNPALQPLRRFASVKMRHPLNEGELTTRIFRSRCEEEADGYFVLATKRKRKGVGAVYSIVLDLQPRTFADL